METQKETKATSNKRMEIPLQVFSVEQLSKNIKRFVFVDGSKLLKQENESGYLKINFPQRNTDASKARSYTIREVDTKNHYVTIDFVCHGVDGPASAWAAQAQKGDNIIAFGPGPNKLVDVKKDWFFIVGDMTSLPAIAVNLKTLPANAKGYVIIEIEDPSDKQQLQKPDALELEWVVNPDPNASAAIMRDKTAARPWLDGTPSVWIAAEFTVARTLRTFLQSERGITKEQYYISSYWKLGDTDEGNKRAKKLDGGF